MGRDIKIMVVGDTRCEENGENGEIKLDWLLIRRTAIPDAVLG